MVSAMVTSFWRREFNENGNGSVPKTETGQSRLLANSPPHPRVHCRYGWDDAGQPTNVWDAGGGVALTFKHQGLWTGAGNAAGLWRQVDFDVKDRPTNILYAGGMHVTNRYDGLDRLLDRGELNSGGVEHFRYSTNVPWMTAYTNQLGTGIVLLTYDVLGRLTNQVFTGMATNRFTYNGAGDLLTLTDGKGQKTTWVYDQYGRALSKTNADGNLAWTNGFNANGWLTAHWTPAKLLTQYAYNAVGNVTNIDYANSSDVRLTYDQNGWLSTMADAIGTTAFTWSEFGALASEDGPWAQDTVTYGHNDALLRQTLTLIAPNGSPWTQSHAYDNSWRLTNVTSAAGAFSYAYAGAQTTPPAQITLPNGAYITNAFDDLGRLTSTELKNSSQTAINSHTYQYDNAHQRTKQTLQDGNYWDYGYDPIGELTSAKGKESGGGNRLHEQLTYGYDAAGNLAARTNNNLQQTFAISNVLNQLSAVTRSTNLTVAGMTTPAATSVTVNGAGATLYADKTFAKEVSNVSGGNNTFTAVATDGARTDTNAVTVTLPGLVTFQYDANGNLTNDTRRTFEYDDADELTAVQVAGSWRSEFKYDAFGRRRVRTEKVWQSSEWVTASETRYVYDHMLVLQERDVNNLPTVTYTRGIELSGRLQRAGGIGGLLARTDSQGTVFYHGDAGGNTTALVDAYQNPVARYRYDPFGNLLGLSGPMAEANLYRFSSKEWHANSGLQYYGFRYYEPSLQRWMNRDPIEEHGNPNLYSYVINSPLNRFDPLGLTIDDPPEDMGFTYNDILQAFLMAREAGIKGPDGQDMLHILLGMLQSPKGLEWSGIKIRQSPETQHPISSRAYPSGALIRFPQCNARSGKMEIQGECGTKFYFHAAILHEMMHAYQAMTGTSEWTKEEEEKEPRRIGNALNHWLKELLEGE